MARAVACAFYAGVSPAFCYREPLRNFYGANERECQCLPVGNKCTVSMEIIHALFYNIGSGAEDEAELRPADADLKRSRTMNREQRKQNFLKRFFRNAFTTEDLFYNNEVQANLMVAMMMALLMILSLVSIVLNFTGVFDIGADGTRIIVRGLIELFIGYILCIVKKGSGRYLKYVLFLILLLHCLRIFYYLSYNVILLLAIPMILSCRYFSVHFTAQISGVTVIGSALTEFLSAKGNKSLLDLNMIPVPKGTVITVESSLEEALLRTDYSKGEYVLQRMTKGYLPKMLILIIIAAACIRIAQRGRQMVLEQAEVAGKSARMESELTLAAKIQEHMLPASFPAFPEHDEFEIYAQMFPAKEVAGDFYDFYMLDETHVTVVIGDVSGKGVPAALFMANAKTLIKDLAQLGLSPEEIFTRVNRTLCEDNASDFFITAWMGTLDLQSGALIYANAGHNLPCLWNGEKTVMVEAPSGLVLGAFSDFVYEKQEMTLKPGMRLFLYTDGVTEAMNPDGTMYGEERLKTVLDRFHSVRCEELLKKLRESVDSFSDEAEQADDISMLALEYCKMSHEQESRIFRAEVGQLPEMLHYLEGVMDKTDVSEETRNQILVSAEEIFVNICDYGYPDHSGEVRVCANRVADGMELQFVDSGIPFNPLLHKSPDTETPIEERAMGGMGIFMVKKMMDEVTYAYENSRNVLTIRKRI